MKIFAKLLGSALMLAGALGLGGIVYTAWTAAAPDGAMGALNALLAAPAPISLSLAALTGGALLTLAALLLGAVEDAAARLDAMDTLARRLVEKQRSTLD